MNEDFRPSWYYRNPRMIVWPRIENGELNYLVSGDGSTKQLNIKDYKALAVILHITSSGIAAKDLCSKLTASCPLTLDGSILLINELLKFQILVTEKFDQSQWFKYGWSEPLRYHSASRMTEFLDTSRTNEPQKVREQIVKGYLHSRELPHYDCRKDSAALTLPTRAEIDCKEIPTTFLNRRTTRNFAGIEVPLETLAQLLSYATSRMAHLRRREQKADGDVTELLRSSDYSAFNINLIIHRIEGLTSGLYRYNPTENSLLLIKAGEFEDEVIHSIWGQPMAKGTSISVFFSCVYERYQWKYRYPRGYQNLLINLGELVQLFIVAATFLNLGVCLTPALRDDFINKLVEVDGTQEEVLYYLGIGVPRNRN